jgi:hypothetical protein
MAKAYLAHALCEGHTCGSQPRDILQEGDDCGRPAAEEWGWPELRMFCCMLLSCIELVP